MLPLLLLDTDKNNGYIYKNGGCGHAHTHTTQPEGHTPELLLNSQVVVLAVCGVWCVVVSNTQLSHIVPGLGKKE